MTVHRHPNRRHSGWPHLFRQRIAKFFLDVPLPAEWRGDRHALTHPLGLTIVAFVVTAIPYAFLLTKVRRQAPRKLFIMALTARGCVIRDVDSQNRP